MGWKVETMAQVPQFAGLEPPLLAKLEPNVVIRKIKRNDDVFQFGEPTHLFAFVASGRVKLVKVRDDDREVILSLAGPGRLVCGNAVYSGTAYCCRAIAIEDTTLVTIAREDLIRLTANHPEAARNFVHELTRRGMNLCKRVDEVGRDKVEARIAMLLLRLADQLGRGRFGAIWIPVSLSRRDLAELCATTVESAIRVMRKFERDGIVRTTNDGFVVDDRERLAAASRVRRSSTSLPIVSE